MCIRDRLRAAHLEVGASSTFVANNGSGLIKYLLRSLRHELCIRDSGKHAKGEMRKIYDWATNKYHGEIPEAAATYNVIGNITEWQVTIGETTYGRCA